MNQDLLIKKIKRKNTGSNLLIAVGAVLDLVPRLLTIHMAASFIAGQLTWRMIRMDGGQMLLSMLLKSVCSYLSTWMAHKAAYTTLTDLRLQLIRHLKQLPVRFFQERKAGGLTNIMQVMTDANIQKFFGVYSHSVAFQYKGEKVTSFSFLDEV